MTEKYIVAVEDRETLYKAVVGADGEPYISPAMGNVYKEPDLDAIRNEAYEKGVQDTKQHWADAPRSCVYKLGYENGLNDLWEAMQKAIKMYCEIDNEVFLRVFYDVKCDWGESVLQALFKNTPQHLIDSIRKYEQRQEEQEKEAGNGEFIHCPKCGHKSCASDVWDNCEGMFCPNCGTDLKRPKTQFDFTAAVLRKMREGGNND